MTLKIDIKQIDHNNIPSLPAYAKDGDAGVDLMSTEQIVLDPGQRAVVPTGIALAIPEGYCGFVLPRSGLAAKYGLTVVNAPGLIDSGYRGEIKVILLNTDLEYPHFISPGDRIAQLIIQKHETVWWNVVAELDETERQLGGLGHTGN